MKLIFESAETANSLETIKNPKEDFIKEELSSEDFDFAILESTNDRTFIQTRKIEESGKYQLEYQDGSIDRHYQTEKPVTCSRAISAFIWYLRGDESWRSEFVWERIVV